MRDRRARVGLVVLMLALPALMVGMSPRTTSIRAAVLPVLATQAVLVAGLSGVARERQRLLAERQAPVSRRPVPSLPHARASAPITVRPLRSATLGR